MNNTRQPTKLLWWILMIAGAGCLVFMAGATVRSIANILRAPAIPPPILAAADTPDQEAEHKHAEIKPLNAAVSGPLIPQAAAAPAPKARKPPKNNITANFEQMLRIEQEKKQVYQSLREQARANPGQPGTLTEEDIRKLEKEGETGDRGFP